MPQRTVRCYADQKLITTSARTDGGYRLFDEQQLRELRFIRRLKHLGLTLAEMRPLIAAAHRGEASRPLRAKLERQLQVIEEQLADLTAVRHELRALVSGDEDPCRDDLCICRCIATS